MRLQSGQLQPFLTVSLIVADKAPRANTPYPDVSGSGRQVLVEPIQRVLPGLFGCGFVVTGGRVVVEAVIGNFVDMTLVRHVRLREGGIECLPSSGDTRVELAVLRIDRRLDLRRIGGAGLRSVEWNASGN
jgi:hypothetical protein